MSSGAERDRLAIFLESCIGQMKTSRQWFTTCVLPLLSDQLRWRPQVGTWSIGECLAHLNLTLGHYLPRLEQSLARNSRAAERGAFLPYPELEVEYLQGVEPPVLVKAISPAPLQPTAAVDPDRIVDQFTDLRERYAKIAQSAGGVDLAGARINGSLHLPVESVGGVLALLAAHDRRHIWQAERIRRGSRFPL